MDPSVNSTDEISQRMESMSLTRTTRRRPRKIYTPRSRYSPYKNFHTEDPSDAISKEMESMSITTTQSCALLRLREKIFPPHTPPQRVHRINKIRPRPPPPRFRSCRPRTNNVTKEELQEEAIRVGVELSVLVAKAMILFSDDIRSVLCFCFLTFKRAGDQHCPVVKRLLCVMEHAFEKYIKPKNGVYKDGGIPIHMKLIKTLLQSFILGFRGLDLVVLSIIETGGINNMSCVEDCNLMIRMDLKQQLKSVNEANGFAKEAIESDFLRIWEDIFEATPQTPQEINQPIGTTYPELFKPLVDECKRYSGFLSDLASLSL